MKHRSRVEREEREEAEKNALTADNLKDAKQIKDLEAKFAAIKSAGGQLEGEDEGAIKAEMEALQKELGKREERIAELEKNKKWNWENMCHVVEERTIVTDDGKAGPTDKSVTSQLPPALQEALAKRSGEKVTPPQPGPEKPYKEIESYSKFVEKHEALLEKYSEISDMDDTRKFLLDEGQVLFADHSQGYLLLSCLEDEMNGKHKRMKLVGRQSQILSHVTELAVSLARPPQDVVNPFFKRIEEPEHKKAFQEAVAGFVEKVQKRAVEKRKEMEAEEKEQVVEVDAGIGPGGLHPQEVFESLPPSMQEAFASRDIEALKKAVAEMSPADAAYHIKRSEQWRLTGRTTHPPTNACFAHCAALSTNLFASKPLISCFTLTHPAVPAHRGACISFSVTSFRFTHLLYRVFYLSIHVLHQM
ncbi:unnamed protein product [Chrysoparadoxa australica]